MNRPSHPHELAITFQYYRDLPAAMGFYESVMGLELSIDQGWSKIYRLVGAAHLGLVDERRGMQSWAASKSHQLCLRVADVDAWHRWITAQGVLNLSPLRSNPDLHIRAFVFDDPEGYQIEIQSALDDAESGGDP